MNQSYDVVLVGLGAMGSAAAYHVARRGLRVLGLDRFAPPHEQGSSHGQTRIIREAYFEHPLYMPLVQRAYELWDELEQTTGRELLRRVLIASPCSGHGFKFSSAIGEALADLLTSGQTSFDTSLFRLGRFTPKR